MSYEAPESGFRRFEHLFTNLRNCQPAYEGLKKSGVRYCANVSGGWHGIEIVI
jgi:hypothetical protein